MRILLLHPEDSPLCGPWSRQRWDLIVDLGRSSPFSAAAWQEQVRCPILRADSFRRGIEDLRLIREMFAPGRRRLLDEEGIDWWDLTSLVVVPQMEDALILRRLASEISVGAELWASRPGWPASACAILLQRPLRTFADGSFTRIVERSSHYAHLFHRFSPGQIKEIFLDKYDSGYLWRSRFISTPKTLAEPVVLLPSAYENVSRMAASYARLLPQQPFLLVATRQSAKKFALPPNVLVRDLAGYAKRDSPVREIASILANWEKLKPDLREAAPEFGVLLQAGVFNPFSQWFRDCLRARDAWREVIESEPVSGVLCGDDSNIYTRLPVLLAARRRIPTVDFHHGALDGRYILKDLPSDAYLVKTEMERDYLTRVCGLPFEKLVDGAPLPVLACLAQGKRRSGASAVLFSEAYENAGLRAEEIYRELLPHLCLLARETGHDVIVKLHPFESATERRRLVRSLLSPGDSQLVTVVEGPTSPRLLSQAWFGITIESTTVLECLSSDVPCFLCGWLTLSSYGYGAQYARFGIGEMLRNAEEIAEIPRRMDLLQSSPKKQQGFGAVANEEELRQLLTLRSAVLTGTRRIS
jgi:hypothetical protein